MSKETGGGALRIDGKAIAAKVRGEVAKDVAMLREKGIQPGLATVLVGEDPASAIYVRNKVRACEEVGIVSIGKQLPASTSQAALLAVVDELNARDDVHGILVQLPLPAGLDSSEIIERIAPQKDVDGLHPVNQGRLLAGQPGLRPCTPLGSMRLLAEAGVELKGKRAIVVGRSVLVGKPIALLLLEQHATVTICHSRTEDLAGEIGRADVVIAALGRAEAIRGEWIKPGAAVIDVGITRTDDGLKGDVEFLAASERAGCITPVPGGVGPMTIAMLLRNTVMAATAEA
ncbi:MAG: bifunctional methylenetetrahydrofolate dehydrogenase/methenyltetrahydrofolate cyclohydrolase FolD [Deltaproteobacteria bacterium]